MTDEKYGGVEEALRRLAAPPEEQETYLLELGVLPSVDELALEFDDALSGVAIGDPPLGQLLNQLNELLEEMSGEENAYLWTPRALQEASEWENVRTLAREALMVLSG